MKSRITLFAVLVFAALLNLGISAQSANADWTDGICEDGAGELSYCCKFCIWFCECTVVVIE